MRNNEELIAYAQRLFDQRQDPFNDEVLCARLLEVPEAMQVIVQMRAVLQQVDAMPAASGKIHRWWPSNLVAAALLLILAQFSQSDSTKPVNAPPALQPPVSVPVPAILNLRQNTRASILNHPTDENRLRVAISTVRTQPS